MLPDLFLKTTKTQLSRARVLKTIRRLGALNVLLLIALIASWAWFLRIQKSVSVHALAEDFAPPVRVEMPLQSYSEQVPVGNGSVLHDPILTVYGKVRQYDGLRETLDGFQVTVAGNPVNPKPITGEFVEKILLDPGRNEIGVAIHWNGAVQYRYQYVFTYVPPPVDPMQRGSGEPALPAPAF